MVRSRTPSQGGGSQGFEMERKYSVPSNPESRTFSGTTSEDLHAWSIYRQNLNSDFTDSALGSADKSPLPYGNFQLRDTTVQSILSHPRYGPKSALGSNMYTYLKFGLPRVFPPNHNGSNRSGTPQQEHHFNRHPSSTRPHQRGSKSGTRGPREGSSGYDSSDNETTAHNNHQYKQSRKYRSDPDFRNQVVHASYHQEVGPGIPLAAMQQGGIRSGSGTAGGGSALGVGMSGGGQWSRNKSISEANLLATVDYVSRGGGGGGGYNMRGVRDPRRNSVADFGHSNIEMDHHHHHHHHHLSHAGQQLPRPHSKAESHMSLTSPSSRRGGGGGGPSVIRNDYINHEDDGGGGPTFIYPHLQLCGVGVWPNNTSCFTRKSHLLLNDISFEIRGGEILAVMSTSEQEGTALLDLIAGLNEPLVGDMILNGQIVKASALRARTAYVQNNSHLCPDMTALQTLRFHHDLKKPTDKLGYLKVDAMDRINVLIEDLGLEQVRNTRVSSMTISERRRLNVACHLLLDTDIVILDQPTRGMDIFDTFFLVEYLRQWASGGSGQSLGRCVILTLHPPTYEIFTMLSRIVLVSAGRTMFSGRRRDMLPYFAMVEYPCPSFKNPSDYYLDLVTLDDLSAEAMLESSQRIEQLAEVFRQKQEPMSNPGPPTALPMTVKNSNFMVQAFILFSKSIFHTQPNTFISWLTLIVIAASISLIVGAIYWDVPNSDPQLTLNDRLGYHYTVMCITLWPILLLLTLAEVRKNRKTVERDIRDGLYGRTMYIVMKSVINLIPSVFVWLIYLVPSYSMSGLYMQSMYSFDGFYVYIGLMLLYLVCLQTFITAFVYMLSANSIGTATLASLLLSVLFISSGYQIHYRDLPIYARWLEYLSPTTWTLPFLLNRELSPEAIATSSATMLCRNKQVQHQDIIVQLPCPPPNGTQVLTNYGYFMHQKHYNDYGNVPIALAVFALISLLVLCVSFVWCTSKSKGAKDRGRNVSNKP